MYSSGTKRTSANPVTCNNKRSFCLGVLCAADSGWVQLSSSGLPLESGDSCLLADLGWPQLGCLEQRGSAPCVSPYGRPARHLLTTNTKKSMRKIMPALVQTSGDVTFTNMPLSKVRHMPMIPESKGGIEYATQRALQSYKAKALGTGRNAKWGTLMCQSTIHL